MSSEPLARGMHIDATRRVRFLMLAVVPVAVLAACQATRGETAGETVAVIARAETQCADGVAIARDDTAPAKIVTTAYRDAAALRALQTRTPELATWRVDLAGGETVLRIEAGGQPNPGWRLRVDTPRFDAVSGLLTVPAAVLPPAPGGVYVQVISFACQYLHLGTARYEAVQIVSPPTGQR